MQNIGYFEVIWHSLLVQSCDYRKVCDIHKDRVVVLVENSVNVRFNYFVFPAQYVFLLQDTYHLVLVRKNLEINQYDEEVTEVASKTI